MSVCESVCVCVYVCVCVVVVVVVVASNLSFSRISHADSLFNNEEQKRVGS